MVEIGNSKPSYTFESTIFKWGEKKNDNEVWEKMAPVQSELLLFLMCKNVSSALQSLTSVDQPPEDAYVRM